MLTNSNNILQHVNPLPVARQHIPNTCQWIGWKAVFSAQSAPMAAHATTDTATEERCFLCCPCLDVLSRTISRAVELTRSGHEPQMWLQAKIY
jgi:hypothetical protein